MKPCSVAWSSYSDSSAQSGGPSGLLGDQMAGGTTLHGEESSTGSTPVSAGTALPLVIHPCWSFGVSSVLLAPSLPAAL